MGRTTSLQSLLSHKIHILLLLVTFLQLGDTLNRIKRQGFVFEGGSSTSDKCTTKEGAEGVCIEVVKCEEATKILVGNPTPAQRKFLTDRTCRFEGGTPFFCCVGGGGVQPPPVNPPEPPTAAPTPVPPPVTASPDPQQRTATLDDLNKVCGITTVPAVRVVGGSPAPLNAWPWMAAIFIADRGTINTKEVACGGVLISSDRILTAAHCAVNRDTRQNRPASDFLVRLGDLDINSDTDGASPVDFDVSEVISHAEYNQATVKNDIALLKLSKPTAFSDAITPICIPTQDLRSNKFERMRPHIAGWGTVEFRGASSSVLQQVQLDIETNSDCQKAFQSFRVTISDTQLCAGFAAGGKDACQGDSGGPLMLPINRKWNTIGVVSVGFKCAEPGFPGIYTRTTEYIDWIKTNAKLQ